MSEFVTSVPVITVDGPSGAGKGTLCRLLAAQTGFALLDSGALYRLTALAAINKGVDVADETAVAEVARHLDVVFGVSEKGVAIKLVGEDVTSGIREEHVGMIASIVAALPAVRIALLDRQRAFAQPPGLVADGRDMGTVVFPSAKMKFFLTASAEVRARRRLIQLQTLGQEPDFTEILNDIVARDERDISRSTAPLRPAKDAHLLDSTDLTIDEVLQVALSKVQI